MSSSRERERERESLGERERERERESERERDACDVNRYHAEIASDHAYLEARRREDPTRQRVLSLSSVHVRQGAWRLSARAAGSSD